MAAFQETHGAEVSPKLVPEVTEAVLDRVEARQSRALDELCPIL